MKGRRVLNTGLIFRCLFCLWPMREWQLPPTFFVSKERWFEVWGLACYWTVGRRWGIGNTDRDPVRLTESADECALHSRTLYSFSGIWSPCLPSSLCFSLSPPLPHLSVYSVLSPCGTGEVALATTHIMLCCDHAFPPEQAHIQGESEVLQLFLSLYVSVDMR